MTRATIKGLSNFYSRQKNHCECLKYKAEWESAILFGWDDDEFIRLYIDYLESTQLDTDTVIAGDKTELKGRPLERLATYFLKHGGVVHNMKELSVHQEWQVDGQGHLYRQGFITCFGKEEAENFGTQLYMECKNHKEPMSNSDYGWHLTRMGEHKCNIGVIFSTSGYSIGKGKGLASSVYKQTLKNIYNILFTVDVFMKVIEEDKPPFFLFQEAYGYAVNERYTESPDLQKRYSKAICHGIAQEEYKRYSLANKKVTIPTPSAP